MNTNTPNTTTPSYNAEAPMASSEAMVTSPHLTTKPNTEHLQALRDCFIAIQLKSPQRRWKATIKLNEVIKKEKKRVMEIKKLKKEEREDDNITATAVTTTAVTTVAPTAPQILAPQVVHQTSPESLGTAKSSTPPPTINRKITTTDKVKKVPRRKTPRKMLQRSQHRSMPITELAQKSGQGRLIVSSTAPEEGPATTGPVKKTIEGLSGHAPLKAEAIVVTEEKEGLANAGIKVNSPALKPRAGAGVMKKKAIVGDLRGRIVGKAKGKGEMKKGVEGQSIATATTTDKATKGPRTKAPPKVPRSPQRRSMRIESMQKSGREEGKSTVAALVEGRKVAEAGPRRQIAVAVVINVKSPILKPKAGAGVPKREGKGGKVGRGKTALA